MMVNITLSLFHAHKWFLPTLGGQGLCFFHPSFCTSKHLVQCCPHRVHLETCGGCHLTEAHGPQSGSKLCIQMFSFWVETYQYNRTLCWPMKASYHKKQDNIIRWMEKYIPLRYIFPPSSVTSIGPTEAKTNTHVDSLLAFTFCSLILFST